MSVQRFSNTVDDASLVDMIVDYIALTDDIISNRTAGKAFSDAALEKTASVLVNCKLLDNTAVDTFKKDIAGNPEKALAVIEKLAMQLQKTSNLANVGLLGKPATVGNKKQTNMRESDKFLYSKFNLI